MAQSPTRTIQTALSSLSRSAKLDTVAGRVRMALTREGWKVVQAKKVDELSELLDTLYVDNRRQRQVETLERARKLAQSL